MSEAWQKDIRSKIEDLSAAAKASNHNFNSWETNFIASLGEKLNYHEIKLSPAQHDKMLDLWDKI